VNKEFINSLFLRTKKQFIERSDSPYFLILEVDQGKLNYYKINELNLIQNRDTDLYVSFLYDNLKLNECLKRLNKPRIYIMSSNVEIIDYANQFFLDDPRFKELNEVYCGLLKNRPYVTLSFGMSLDGKIATRTGDSKYISGQKSRTFVHQLRNSHDAILVGINTVMIDHPLLTTRLKGQSKDPIKVVLDSDLKIDLNEPILSQLNHAKTIIFTRKSVDFDKVRKIMEQGHEVISLDTDKKPLDLKRVLQILKEKGIHSMLVEGGSTIHFSFIESGLFDRLFSTISPIIIGGVTAKSAVEGVGFETLKESCKLDFNKVIKRGSDYIIKATPRKEGDI
jgi:diaminohydroxyphosphoribosylaminopyrimidine deaminase/5-amino-6-(5-phosphoribosylamino)uracil reductase